MVSTYVDKQAGIADILGTVHGLHTLCSSTDFREWCQTYQGIQASADVFEGYAFAARTLIRMLHDRVASNYTLQLSED